jgi:hypothetical protein
MRNSSHGDSSDALVKWTGNIMEVICFCYHGDRFETQRELGGLKSRDLYCRPVCIDIEIPGKREEVAVSAVQDYVTKSEF